MRPGMIITSYKTVDNDLNSDLHNENNKSELEHIEEVSLKIIEESKQKAQIEYEQILKKAKSILNECEILKDSIEKQYLENLKLNCDIDLQNYLQNKENEFNNIINKIDANFVSIQKKSQDDIHDILLNTYKSFFGEEFKNPNKIKNMICNNFYGFDNCKESELVLAKEVFDDFNSNLKDDLEEELNIVINNIKSKKNLSGFILNTNLGSIECDLEKQIQSLKEQLDISK